MNWEEEIVGIGNSYVGRRESSPWCNGDEETRGSSRGAHKVKRRGLIKTITLVESKARELFT